MHGYEWFPAVEAYLGPHLLLGVPIVTTVLYMTLTSFLPRCAPLVVGSESLREYAVEQGFVDVTVLGPPVDVRGDHPGVDGGSFRAEYGLEPDVPLLAVVSRLARSIKLEGILTACDVWRGSVEMAEPSSWSSWKTGR